MDKARWHRETALLLLSNAIDHMLLVDPVAPTARQRQRTGSLDPSKRNVTRRLGVSAKIAPFRRPLDRERQFAS
jgi:2-polyprenyl-6-methoxyphenol hydroxylase-like FAD-dependent oxidoreductase